MAGELVQFPGNFTPKVEQPEPAQVVIMPVVRVEIYEDIEAMRPCDSAPEDC